MLQILKLPTPSIVFNYLRTGLRLLVVDRGMLFTDFVLATTVPFLVQFLIWRQIFHSSEQDQIQNFSFSGLLFYYAFALILSRLHNGYDLIEKLAEDIHEGTLEVFLVKPLSLLWQRFLIFVGESLLYCVLLGSFFFFQLVFQVSTGGEVEATLLAGLGILTLIPFLQGICFVLAYLMASLTVKTVRADLLLSIHLAASAIFGGLLLPPEFWPSTLIGLMKYNPYAVLISMPAEFLANPSLESYLVLFMTSIATLLVLGALLAIVWPRLLALYRGVGG